MRKRVVVAGGDYADTIRAVAVADVFDLAVDEPDEISGADVVVVAEADPGFAAVIRDRAPNAVVVIAGVSPEPICETTLFPRARIIGVDGDPASVAQVVEAILLDHTREFETVVRCEGERGIQGEFARVPVLIGGSGVVEIIDSH